MAEDPRYNADELVHRMETLSYALDGVANFHMHNGAPMRAADTRYAARQIRLVLTQFTVGRAANTSSLRKP